MIVICSGTMLAWTCTTSELDKLPKHSSTRYKPFITINLRSGEITARGVSSTNLKSVTSGFTRLATAISADPIADRYMRFGGLRASHQSSSLYSGHELELSYIDRQTNNRIIVLPPSDRWGYVTFAIAFAIGYNGYTTGVSIRGRRSAIRFAVHRVYQGILREGVSMYEEIDEFTKEDII